MKEIFSTQLFSSSMKPCTQGAKGADHSKLCFLGELSRTMSMAWPKFLKKSKFKMISTLCAPSALHAGTAAMAASIMS